MNGFRALENQAYWDGLREGRLLFQQCEGCGALRHYPRPMCLKCHDMRLRWTQASGAATVHSWTVVHHSVVPGFEDHVPYTLVTADMAEGVRVVAPLRGAKTPHIGMRLRAVIAPGPAGEQIVFFDIEPNP